MRIVERCFNPSEVWGGMNVAAPAEFLDLLNIKNETVDVGVEHIENALRSKPTRQLFERLGLPDPRTGCLFRSSGIHLCRSGGGDDRSVNLSKNIQLSRGVV